MTTPTKTGRRPLLRLLVTLLVPAPGVSVFCFGLPLLVSSVTLLVLAHGSWSLSIFHSWPKVPSLLSLFSTGSRSWLMVLVSGGG